MSAAPPRDALSLVTPMPAALPLAPEYDRHAPGIHSQRAVLLELVAGRDWARCSWQQLIEALFALGRTDVPLSRLAEGHIDAVRILSQAAASPRPRAKGAGEGAGSGDALYGVWASRSMQTGVAGRALDGGGLLLEGTLRFASGAGALDRALVPTWVEGGHHLLVDLATEGLPVDCSSWHAAGMAASRTCEVRLEQVRVEAAQIVGPTDFYLRRPGFFPAGVGVAACWTGGAARVVDLLRASQPAPSAAQQQRLGRIRTELVSAAAAVRLAAARLDASTDAEPLDRQLLATEARACAAGAIRRLLTEARLLAGPAGVALDEQLSHVLPDLELYVLQQNGDADSALLGDPERFS